MGLDIYVRWGEEEKDDSDGKVLTFPEDRAEDQYTGMVSAPHAGYLRESWGSLRWVETMTVLLKPLEAPNPYGFFPDWEGYNGEVLMVNTPESLQALLDYRDKRIRVWLRGTHAEAAIPIIAEYVEREWRRMKAVGDPSAGDPENQSAVIRRAVELWEAFKGRLTDVWGTINFVELHRDEPNLQIVFW